MGLSLPLEDMTISDKLQLMEQIWSDLCTSDESMPSPDWHGDVLSIREQRIREGKAEFTDWSEAKDKMRSKTTK